MIRLMQIDDEVIVMTGVEHDGKLTLGEMRIIPLVIYNNLEKGFKYDQVL